MMDSPSDNDVSTSTRASALVQSLGALGFGTMLGTGDGRILDADDVMCEMTGRSREELLALNDVAILLAPDERHHITARRRDRISGPVAPFLVNTTLIRPDGSRIHVEFAAAEVERNNGEITLVVVGRDVSGEHEVVQRVQRYERLAEFSPVGIILWDLAGVDDPLDMRVLAANPAAQSALPQLAGEHHRKRFGDLFADSLDDARRTFAVRGTGGVEQFSDLVIGDPDRPDGVHRRRAIDLGRNTVAITLENVTGERTESIRRRGLLENLVDAGDAERRTFAFAMHDEPLQHLAAATLLIEALRRNPDAPARKERLDTVEESLRSAMATLRRLVFELSPPELVESGLQGAIDSAAAFLFEGSTTEVTLDVDVPDEPDLALQTAAYRIAAEALSNASKHARAAQVLVDLHVDSEAMHILISDNGCGFQPPIMTGRPGLRTMRLRATALGGDCRIETGPDGTRVRAWLPLGGRRAQHAVTAKPRVRLADAASTSDIDALRLERDGLAARNERQHDTMDMLQDRLRHTLALWTTLDDSSLDAEEVVQRTVRHVSELCPDGCGVRLVADDGASWALVAGWHPDPAQLAYLNDLLVLHGPDEPSHPRTAMVGNAAVLLGRRASTWGLGSLRPIPQPPKKVNSVVLAPIRIEGVPVGVLTVMRDLTGTRLGEQDVDLIQTIADRLGAALRRAGR
jgi:PAS domain S-box-containing protein